MTLLTSDPPLTIAAFRQTLRPGQQALADWEGGCLAVSAVPGAGKSTGMAAAAAIAIARHHLSPRQQLMVVTLTRSAVANLKAKIKFYLQQLGLPQQGFQVQTLHGLAWAIARTHLELTELNAESILVTPTQNNRLLRTIVEQWIAANPRHYQQLLEGRQFDGEETERLRRQSVLRTEVLPTLAQVAIREAKSSGLTVADLQALATTTTDDYQVLAIAAGLYERYQAEMRRRNWMDYDEMMLAALRVLEDPSVRQHWQQQIFAVFEDEAQDSSPLQSRLLSILAADPLAPENSDRQNLVRVGDPNQAINSTFTPADPIFFRDFCDRCDQQHQLATMTEAGRSASPIMEAANYILTWANAAKLTGAEIPFRAQTIQPVGAADAQPNPAPEGTGLELHTPADVQQTVEWIGKRAIALFRQNSAASAAVLVRENKQGQFVAQELARWYGEQLPLYEVGSLERQTQVPAELLSILQWCDRPHSPDYLKAALNTLIQRHRIPPQDVNALTSFPEQFLYPGPLDPVQDERVMAARQLCVQLLQARLELPAHQLIPFLAYTLQYDQSELATADKLGDRLSQQTQQDNRLPVMIAALNDIVAAEQFEPVNPGETDERYTQPGTLTIITMHKAKGLDWDYVFIPFVHETFIPGRSYFPPQIKFLGDFALADIARAQIRAHLHPQPTAAEIPVWERAQSLKTAEELRLLYVAMTRAKRLLWMSAAAEAPFSWNRPDRLESRAASPAFLALKTRFPHTVIA